MDFLDNGDNGSSPFKSGEVYSTDKSGTLAIQKNKGLWVVRYFFRGPGLDGETVHYRLDGDVSSFEVGDAATFPKDNNYVLDVNNLRVSVDTGKKSNGYEGSFPETATINLDRSP
jgi:hypothetical protein